MNMDNNEIDLEKKPSMVAIDLTTLTVATIDELIERLTPQGKDTSNYAAIFFSTFPLFLEPEELMKLLLNKFNDYYKEQNDNIHWEAYALAFQKIHNVVKKRVLGLFRVWIKYYFDDFSNDALKSLLSFTSSLVLSFTEKDFNIFSHPAIQTQYYILKAIERRTNIDEEFEDHVHRSSTQIIPLSSPFMGRVRTILDFSPADIAHMFTLRQFSVYKDLKPRDILEYVKLKTISKVPSMANIARQDTLLSYFITILIVEATNRDDVIDKLMLVTEELERYKNYAGIIATIAGLTHFTVKLNPKYNEFLEKHNHIVDNYQRIRGLIENAKCPFIPYLGILLKDITYFNENKTVTEENGVKSISFKKMKSIYQDIKIFAKTYLKSIDKEKEIKYEFKMNRNVEELYEQKISAFYVNNDERDLENYIINLANNKKIRRKERIISIYLGILF